ncbi:hypothetical protein [Prauserella muralis]|uniref:Uncharacterized protein n=1 Tax=Prauserella muralis TaxID=588067 RepID=A0A2V4BP76_9PSEU|nr:hypothetical protein [Prauserella muralis]PXY32413.1 hypothetical protein BAY60_09110 [Prauserella muralis]TWE23898.1 hypothetical protein FHX69_5200 [Prauserella muralis]
MRTRAVLAGAASALLLLVPACATEAGPTPKAAPADPGPAALRVKLNALAVDVCFKTPTELDPPSCQKYVIQLASVPDTAERFAGEGHPELARAARELRSGIQAYRSAGCGGGGTPDECTKALSDIAGALERVKGGVERLPQASATPG